MKAIGSHARLHPVARIGALCAFAVWMPVAGAQVYKCTDAGGTTSYTDSPCRQGQKALAIPNSATAGGAGATVCAQLLDELNRLAAARDRSKAPPSSRAKSLTKQYEARCVGVSRTHPPPQ